jgi:hypothetical protein
MTQPGPLGKIRVEHHAIQMQTYQPQLLASITNPSIGAGSTGGRWWRDPITGRVWGELYILFGQGANPGDGIYRVTLPTPATGFFSGGSTGRADIWGQFTVRDDSNTGGSVLGFLTRNTGSGGPGGVAVADLSLLDGSGAAYIRNNVPFPFAPGDAIVGRFDYMSPI